MSISRGPAATISDSFSTGRSSSIWGNRCHKGPLRLFTNRLLGSMTNRSTYDRYTLYRLLGQLGQDSFPAARSKININYANDILGLQDDGVRNATNFVPWTPIGFFTSTGEQLLREHRRKLLQEFGLTQNIEMAGMGVDAFEKRLQESGIPQVQLSITNISVYPVNLFTHEVRRLFQVVANIYDATGPEADRASRQQSPLLPIRLPARFQKRRNQHSH